MAQTTMYPAKAGSTQTTITATLTDSATSVFIAEMSAFPAVGSEGGNLITFWDDNGWETCLYTAKSTASGAGTLTISRTGTAHASSTGGGIEWASGTKCARNLTAYDLDVIKANIADHETRIALAQSKVSSGDTTPGYLDDKLVAGDGIILTKGSAGANETLTISSSGGDALLTSLIFG